jgi:hypothetical protein
MSYVTVEPQAICFTHLSALPWLRHGVTLREGSGLAGNLAFSRGPSAEAVIEARRRWAERIGLDPTGLVVARQVHGADFELVTREQRGRGATSAISLPAADALLTNVPNVPLLAVFADCVPVLLADPVCRAIAVVHAGWRGAVVGIVEAAVAAMASSYGSAPATLLAGIGPSIGPCCYVVGMEVAAAASDRYGSAVLRTGPAPDNPILDLWAVARRALLAAGLHGGNIETLGVCTRCHNHRFFSHRAEGPVRGLFGVMIGIV